MARRQRVLKKRASLFDKSPEEVKKELEKFKELDRWVDRTKTVSPETLKKRAKNEAFRQKMQLSDAEWKKWGHTLNEMQGHNVKKRVVKK